MRPSMRLSLRLWHPSLTFTTPPTRLAQKPCLDHTLRTNSIHRNVRHFASSVQPQATFNQVLRGCRVEQRARKSTSPALLNRRQLKGVCVKVGTMKPKKPNSGERKTARVRLSNGKVVTAYIPGEGTLEPHVRRSAKLHVRFRTGQRANCYLRAQCTAAFGSARSRWQSPRFARGQISSCQRGTGSGMVYLGRLRTGDSY